MTATTPPSDPATPDAAVAKADAFVAALPTPSDRGARESTYARAGFVVMCIGMVVAVVAVILSQASDNALDQNTQITLAIAGVAAVAFGGVVFLRYSLGRLLRFWLLRVLDRTTRND